MMKALRWHGRRDLRVDDVSEPKALPGWVVVEVSAVGICGSDLHEYAAGPLFIPTKPHPITGRFAPITLGHEFCGRVVEVGEGVSRLRVGERVAVDACVRCNECYYCRHGNYVLCDRLVSLGFAVDGAMARYVAVPEYAAYVLPDAISDDVGAMIEPLSVAVHALRRGRLEVGEQVVVVGAGPIGLLCLLAARACGAGQVYVVEPEEGRRKLAQKLGASGVIDPRAGDPLKTLRALSGGGRADLVLECVGAPDTPALAVRLARKGARIVLVGVFEREGTLNFNSVVMAEREIIGSAGYVEDFPRAIALVADGRVDPRPLISDKVGLSQAVARGFERLLGDRSQSVKILIDPSR